MYAAIEEIFPNGASNLELSRVISLFKEMLLVIKSALKDELQHPKCFISYAWEVDNGINLRLQAVLRLIKTCLESLGAIVYLDITNLASSLNEFMDQRIGESDFVFLIGTPRLKSRISNDETNAAREFRHIMNRTVDKPSVLVPLLLDGDYSSAFPAEVMENLIRDVRGLMANEITIDAFSNFIRTLIDLNPLGIIPMIYKVEHPAALHAPYQSIITQFNSEIGRINTSRRLIESSECHYQTGKKAAMQGDDIIAYTSLLAAAKANHFKSMLNLSKLLAYGKGTDVNISEALIWANRAKQAAGIGEQTEASQKTLEQIQRKEQENLADGGDQYAMANLACMLWAHTGVSRPENTPRAQWEVGLNREALRWAHTAREAGDDEINKLVKHIIAVQL